MRKHNFIEKWKPVLMFVGILAVMVVICLLVWLFSGGEDRSDDPVVNTTAATEDSWQDTTWPSEDVTEPSSSDVTDPSLPEDTQPPSTDPTQPGVTEPVLPPITEPTDPPTSVIPQQNRLSCDKIAIFSGRFVEDGSDKPAENVVSLLITNRSD